MLSNARCNRIGLALGLLLAVTLALAVILLSAFPILAQDEDGGRAAHTAPYWSALYWNNRDLSGSPTLARDEATLNHDWGAGSPDPSINPDRFSARWTRYVDTDAGTYRFRVTSDDGIRLFVDDQALIDRWYDHGAQTFEADRHLNSGHHLLRVDYYENSGAALARLDWELQWQPVPRSGPWRGEYFNNRDLQGNPVFVRESDRIDYDWGVGSPEPGRIDDDNFSVRWTRRTDIAPGHYRFRVTSDDGARLWVDDHLLVDAWYDQSPTTHVGKIYLDGGEIPLRLDYYEHEGAARIRLDWQRDEGRIDWKSPIEEGLWRAEYYDNRNLEGAPALVRLDRDLNFDWGHGTPIPGTLGEDNFSVRWTRAVHFGDDDYRFIVECDDGVRLYVDDRVVMDEWHDMPRTRMHRDIEMDKGYHVIRVEYYEHEGVASASLGWERTDKPAESIGNIITCVPPQPANQAWIKLYRLDGGGNWVALGSGIGSIEASGFLKIDGLPVDVGRFGSSGEPYRVEQWIDGHVAHSVGNYQIGEPEFRVRPHADNFTAWPCS